MATDLPVSPLAPAVFPDMPVIDGVRFASVAAGIKYQNRTDLMLAYLTTGSAIAGVFTRSSTRSAAVLDCEAKIGQPQEGPAAILVNSGNANAFTGKAGFEAVNAITFAVAQKLDVSVERIFTASTGVIGELLDHAIVTRALTPLEAGLTPDGIDKAARAIMTTDTFAKGATEAVEIGGKIVKIAGIAKGSGMIAPDMATMLVYIFTDAQIAQPDLQRMIDDLTKQTFNRITVDSDTSTSDTLICAATGASGVDVAGNTDFRDALYEIMLDLAHQVVRDGEGATKFITVNVTGAASEADAENHARAIANSPLVKTAIAGEDPNWGRIVMALGKSGAAADRDRLTIRFGDVLVAENGWVASSYTEDQGAEAMKAPEIDIHVDLGLGQADATVWTCDLTHGYIRINADYRS